MLQVYHFVGLECTGELLEKVNRCGCSGCEGRVLCLDEVGGMFKRVSGRMSYAE